MNAAIITALIVGVGTFFGGLAALLQARSDNKKKIIEGSSLGETALANAVKVVEEVYDKVTDRLNANIDELLSDNKKLRIEVKGLQGLRDEVFILKENERKCRAEVALLRMEVQAKGNDAST